MLASIARWWSKKRLAKLKVARGADRTLRRLSSYNTFLILLDPEDIRAGEQINQLVKELKEQRKRVEVCTYSGAKEVPAHLRASSAYLVLRPIDVNWYERPVSERALRIMAMANDILLDFTHEPPIPVQWLAVGSKASIKVGFAQQAFIQYDLLIAAGERSSTRERIELLWHYLGEDLQEPTTAEM